MPFEQVCEFLQSIEVDETHREGARWHTGLTWRDLQGS
jgi:hypothetical protein